MKYHILIWYKDDDTFSEIYHEEAMDAAVRHGESTGCPYTVYLGEIVAESDED